MEVKQNFNNVVRASTKEGGSDLSAVGVSYPQGEVPLRLGDRSYSF